MGNAFCKHTDVVLFNWEEIEAITPQWPASEPPLALSPTDQLTALGPTLIEGPQANSQRL